MSKPKQRLDPTVFAGLGIALACILGGLLLEKGELRDVAQVTSALIVVGGTIGAVVVSTPQAALSSALRRLPTVLWSSSESLTELAEALVGYAVATRRGGVASLEAETSEVQDPFLKKAMGLVVDGFGALDIRAMLETDLLLCENRASEDAKVYDAAGGYAPTIGIIGAVLGLMQVMKHLDNIQDVGRGIAIAFVATVYGVGVANLLFLPLAAKIRAQARLHSKRQEMIIEAAICIQEAKNPRLLRNLLEPFVVGTRGQKPVPEAARTGRVEAGIGA